MPVNPKNIVKSVNAKPIILPLLVHAHFTAALPNSLGECVGDIGMDSVESPAITMLRQKVSQC